MKLRGSELKKKIVCVSESDILIYATFPFQSPGDMVKNLDEKPNMGAVEAKRQYLERRGG